MVAGQVDRRSHLPEIARLNKKIQPDLGLATAPVEFGQIGEVFRQVLKDAAPSDQDICLVFFGCGVSNQVSGFYMLCERVVMRSLVSLASNLIYISRLFRLRIQMYGASPSIVSLPLSLSRSLLFPFIWHEQVFTGSI